MNNSSNQIDLSVIVVSWNVEKYLQSCLHSLSKDIAQAFSYETIVVDNNSTDNSVTILKRNFPEVKLIQNKDNVGFARANNQAMAISRGRFILLLNPDTEIKKGCIKTLLSFMQDHSDVGVVGPQLLNPDGTTQASGLNFPALTNNLLGFLRLHKNVTGAYLIDVNEPVRVSALVGACLLVKREVIDQVGGFDEDYFMYVEEADWCYRIGRAGWSIYYMPCATVLHYSGQSSKHIPTQMYIALRKSRVLFLLKHRNRFEAIVLSAGYAVSSFLKILFGSKQNKSIFQQTASEFLSSTLALFARNSKICRKVK